MNLKSAIRGITAQHSRYPNECKLDAVIRVCKGLAEDIKEDTVDKGHCFLKNPSMPIGRVIVRFLRRFDKEEVFVEKPYQMRFLHKAPQFGYRQSYLYRSITNAMKKDFVR